MKFIYSLIFALVITSQVFAGGVLFMAGGVESGGGTQISDDFSTDTSGDYTAILGTITVSGGQALGQSNAISVLYHDTTLDSPDHYSEALCTVSNNSDSSGVVTRCDGTDYYSTYFSDGSKVQLTRSGTVINTYFGSSGDFSAGTYTVKMTVTGTGATVNILIDVDDVNVMDYDDTSGSRLTSGARVGFTFRRAGENGACYIDDFEAD